MEQEIAEKEEALAESKLREETLLQEMKSLREKYTKNEREVVSLQTKLEGTQKELKQLHQQNRELEMINDQCEQSARALEYYKQDLEERLYQAEENMIIYKEERDELNSLKQEEVHRLKEQCRDLQQEIQVLRIEPKKEVDLESTTTSIQPPASSLKVIARVRPLNKEETKGHVELTEKAFIVKGENPKEFHFERILGFSSTQSDIFAEVSTNMDAVARGGGPVS